MTTLGAIYLPQFPPERLLGAARAADAAGLEQLWLWEDCFLYSGVTAASAVLATTERLSVGIGLMPVPLRNVALTAMEIATLDRLFPGRVLPGVGHGVLDWMGQVGARAQSPMTLLREYVQALQALLAGETVTVTGRYVTLDAVTLDWPPVVKPGLYVGAVKPRTLRLSGELAEGTVLTGQTSPSDLSAARTEIDAGRADGQRSDPHRIVVYLPAATGPDAAVRLQRELLRWGRGSGPDPGVAGDAQTIARAVNRWAEAGADTVVLQPTLDEPDIEAFLRFVGERVRPLVR